MEPRQEVKPEPKVPQVRKQQKKPKLQIVKLEERITPGINLPNHNETLVRDRPTTTNDPFLC
jgi:hypothetical protein